MLNILINTSNMLDYTKKEKKKKEQSKMKIKIFRDRYKGNNMCYG